jgi:WD40 repeat protein
MEGTTRLWRTEKRHLPLVLEGSRLMAGFSGDGRNLVAGASNGWCVWTPESGERMDIPFPSASPVVDFGKPYDVERDEFIGALGRINGTVELWDLQKKANLTEWRAHNDGISVITFSPDGKNLATGTTNGAVKIWDLASQREVMGFGPVGCHFYCLAFSPDGNTLAGSGVSSTVWLWDAKTGRELRQLKGHDSTVGQVAFSPDGMLLATVSFSGEVRLWELPSGAELPPLKGHVISVIGAAFSPDGKTLATSDGHKVKLWNVVTRQELTTIPVLGKFPTLSFSPDQRMLILSERPETEGHIRVLSAPSFEDIAEAEAKRDLTDNLAR